MLVDTSYDHDSMPSFVLCEKELNGARFELRAWVGFDEDDIEKTEFLFDLGLNINDVYQFEYSSQISSLFDDVDSRILVNSSDAEKKYDKVIELIKTTRSNIFPDKLEQFIINNNLCNSD